MFSCQQQGGLDYILIVHQEQLTLIEVLVKIHAGSGVIAEVVTTASSLLKSYTFRTGGNMDSPVSTNMYVAIQNLSSTTQHYCNP